jgi:hypothetical protein
MLGFTRLPTRAIETEERNMFLRSIVLVMLLGSLSQTTATAQTADTPPADFYVAPQGSDAWSGKLAVPNADRTDGPLATLQGARDAIRRLKTEGPLPKAIRVRIRGGTYRVTGPIVLAAEDSGTEKAPITYAAYPGERPVISGGVPITGWKKQGDGPLWTAPVPPRSVRSSQPLHFRQLFVDGRRAVPARLPNEGYFRAAGPGVPYKDREAARRDANTKTSLHYQNDDLKPWSNLDDAVVVVYHSWTTSRHRIQSLDTEKKLVEFTARSGWPMGWCTGRVVPGSHHRRGPLLSAAG